MSTRRICWDQSLVRQLFTTEADTKLTKESFLRLHQPFDRIRLIAAKPYIFAQGDIQPGEEQEQFVSETGLLRAIQGTDIDAPNRIFVLTGEPGSGKSHLARWLHHMLDGRPDRFPIHIPRRINTLVGVLKELSNVAGLRLREDPSPYLLEAPPMKVVRYLIAYLDMAFGVGTPIGERLPLLGRVVMRPEFEALLARQVARYQAGRRLPTNDGIELIAVPEEDFGRLAPGGTLAERTDAYATLRYHLTAALRKLTNLDGFDLKDELVRVSRTLVASGRRPILILEDITSFDLLHDDLLTFLLDEAAGNFDALVCWTTGYEKAYLRTYQLDRYAARLTLSDANMEVYALQGDGFQRMVKGYLDVVKPWCKRGVCDLYDQCVPAFEGLYPFNPQSLERIYENLIGTDQQQRRTPRNLLDRAVKAYLEIAETQDGPFPPLKQPAVVRDILYPDALFRQRESYPAFVALAGWYGKEEGGHLTLNPSVPELLGVSVPEHVQKDGRIIVPVQEKENSGLTVSPALAPKHVSGEANHSAESVQRLACENHVKELRLEVQAWSTSLKVPPHAHELVRGLHRLFGLFKLRLPMPLGHPAGAGTGLFYGKFQGESNLTLAGARGKATPAHQLFLHPADPCAMARDEEVWQAGLELQMNQQLPAEADIAFLSLWCHRRYSEYASTVEASLESVLGMSVRQWVVAARWALLAAQYGRTTPTYAETVGAVTLLPLPADLRLNGAGLTELDMALAHVQALLEGCFAVSKGVWDAHLLSQAIAQLRSSDFLSILANIAHTRVDADFRVGGTVLFRDLVRTVKQVAGLLLQSDRNCSVAACEELLGAAAVLRLDASTVSPRMDDVRRLIGLTERYDLYDPVVGKDWEDGRHGLAEAQAVADTLAEVGSAPGQTVRDYAELAGRLAHLRALPGVRAAWAVARTAQSLAVALNLDPAKSVMELLAQAIDRLQDCICRPQVSVEDALAVLEMQARTVQARDAIRVLRQELLAGDKVG